MRFATGILQQLLSASRPLAVMVLLSAVGGGALGCKATTRVQCNDLVEQANGSGAAVKALNLNTEDPATLDVAAGAIEAEAKKIEAVDVEDQKLVSYKTDYVTLYRSLAKFVRDAAALFRDVSEDDAVTSDNKEQATKLLAAGKTLTGTESSLVNSINGYCQSQ